MTDASSRPQLYIPALQGLYDSIADWSYPVMRFFVGFFLMPHGAQKLFGLFGGNIDGTVAFFSKYGIEPALPLAYVVGCTEFFGGLCIAIGFLTRPAAIGVMILMAMAIWNVHFPNGFFWTKLGFEYPALWGVLAFAIFCRGGGKYSVDRLIGKEF